LRDITNNLKLYRSEILKELEITSPYFSANLETGLKPQLAGYDIVEVPTSPLTMTFRWPAIRQKNCKYGPTMPCTVEAISIDNPLHHSGYCHRRM